MCLTKVAELRAILWEDEEGLDLSRLYLDRKCLRLRGMRNASEGKSERLAIDSRLVLISSSVLEEIVKGHRTLWIERRYRTGKRIQSKESGGKRRIETDERMAMRKRKDITRAERGI
jgi:hypothetical protein